MRHFNLHSHSKSHSATLVFVPSSSGKLITYYATSVLSSLPMSDLVLFSLLPAPTSIFPESTRSASSSSALLPAGTELEKQTSIRMRRIKTLPVNPYPAPEGTPARVQLVSFPTSHSGQESLPASDTGAIGRFQDSNSSSSQEQTNSTTPGLVAGEWTNGSIMGYRDRAGREAQVCQCIIEYSFLTQNLIMLPWNISTLNLSARNLRCPHTHHLQSNSNTWFFWRAHPRCLNWSSYQHRNGKCDAQPG